MATLLLFGGFLLFAALSVPIGIALGMAVMIVIIFTGTVDLTFMAQGLTTAMNSFPLMAAPFFILAGEVMGRGGISRRLLKVADVIFGRFTGGLALVTVAACMLFAAISGTGSATVAAIGSIMAPEMINRGYNKGFAGGLVAASGAIGAMIPPSITMVIYCVTAGVSITALFSAGIVPGIVIGISLMIYSLIYSKKNGYVGNDFSYSRAEVIAIVKDGIPALLMPIIILGGIYGGIFTPTEAAAVAVMYGFIVSLFYYREITWRDISDIVLKSALMTSVILVIIGTSAGFGRILALERIPQLITAAIVGFSSNKIVILLILNLLLLFVGTFMETLAAVIILTPILLPVVTNLGMSPVHFGVMMVINLAIGFVTPPLGANLFVTTQIMDISFEEIAKAIIPFIITMVIALLFITFIPAISMTLPTLFGF
jgi:C4-dicarboxylate transporter, DctM subunit